MAEHTIAKFWQPVDWLFWVMGPLRYRQLASRLPDHMRCETARFRALGGTGIEKQSHIFYSQGMLVDTGEQSLKRWNRRRGPA